MKMGLCTGVFDLLHYGHKNFLKKASQYCDFLLVAVASDWLTRIQKGEKRPYQNENIRRSNVNVFFKENKINGVAFITDELDFSYLLNIVDVYIWGEDQKNVRPVETENAIVVRLPYTQGISTTMLLKKIKSKGDKK